MMAKVIKVVLYVITLLFVSIGLLLLYHFQFIPPAVVSTEEIYRDDETVQIERSIINFIRVIDENTTDYAPRGAHAKGHACVKAWFEVNQDINAEFQHGVFRNPGDKFKSWIRFSNGRSSIRNNHDADKDAHGMAIKLLLQQSAGNSLPVQDFLMHDHPVFFTANIDDYNRFVESENKILYFISDINPFKWKLREMQHGLNTLKKPPSSPLGTQYFSNTAYKLGPHNIKFSAKSCLGEEQTYVTDRDDPDFLKNTMQSELENQNGCFDFMVQKQNEKKYMPIEDPSVQWLEKDMPLIRVARITIPEQRFNSPEQHEFCENMTFSPWHGLEAHRPIGQLNRIRKLVYEASAKYRLSKNNKQPTHDLLW